MFEINTRNVNAMITHPTLIISGKLDVFIRLNVAEKTARKNSELRM
jgi:hypothetical protein